MVELNSNVRAGEKEIQGEIMRVWTWIGTRYVEPAPERRLLTDAGTGAKAGALAGVKKEEDDEEEWNAQPRILA